MVSSFANVHKLQKECLLQLKLVSNCKPKIVNERNVANGGPTSSMLFIQIFGPPLDGIKNCYQMINHLVVRWAPSCHQ